jgi:apolipoprotein N-acyltransferase
VARHRQVVNPAKVKAQYAAIEAGASGAAAPRSPGSRRARLALLSALSIVMLSVSFAPFDCWFLAYVALVPWVLALGAEAGRRRALLLAWGAGLVFWLANLYWLWWITLLGYFLGAVYLSLYWLAAGAVVRRGLHRGWPMWLVLPVVWVALEYVRSYVIGFPWLYLAHSQYARTPLIQIADVTGQYGVSFFVAMVNGAAVDLLRPRLLPRCLGRAKKWRGGLWGVAASAAMGAAMLSYGWWRLGEPATSAGPVIGIVQQAFPISLSHRSASWDKVLDSHLEAAQDLVGEGCDLVLVPESMLPPGMNVDFLTTDVSSLGAEYVSGLARRTYSPQFRQEYSDRYLIEKDYLPRLRDEAQRVGQLSRRLDCPILAGGVALRPNPAPLGPYDYWLKFNSALWFDAADSSPRPLDAPASRPAPGGAAHPPGATAPAGAAALSVAASVESVEPNLPYYSKMHLVPFSEYVPFKKSWLGLHKLLRSFVPEAMEQLEPGEGPVTYDLVRPAATAERKSPPGSASGAPGSAPAAKRQWRLAAPICYEGSFDYVCRDLVWRDGAKAADILANLSNDGWFVWQLEGGGIHRSTEYAQHLAQYCFRSVENRVPVVRAVNTGISASIDSSGRLVQVLHQGPLSIMVAGTLVLDGGEGRDSRGVQHGPLVLVDRRWSVYSRVGNVFAMLVGVAAILLTGLLARRRPGPVQGETS